MSKNELEEMKRQLEQLRQSAKTRLSGKELDDALQKLNQMEEIQLQTLKTSNKSLSTYMSGRSAAFLLFVAAIFSYVMCNGINEKAFLVFIFLAMTICVTWFFSSRRSKEPSAVETSIATIWLFIRRVVGFTGAFCLSIAAFLVGFQMAEIPLFERLVFMLLLFAMAAFCVWVAIFGQGQRKYDFRDDVSLHRENKRRYRWRW